MHNFNRALRSCLIFGLIVALISGVIAYPYFHSETYHYQDGYVRDRMAGSLDLIICGASQAQRGISPAVLDETLGCNSYNIGSPLMTLEGRYTILKKELERNPVDTVILELCYDTMCRDRDLVGPEGDYYMMGRFTDPLERVAYFFTSARLDEYADFYCDILQRGINSWKNWRYEQIGTSASYETKGFAPLATNAIEMPAEEGFHQEAIATDVVEENLEYLEKILELCQERQVKVIIVATPLADGAILSYDKLDTIHQFYTQISEKWGCEYYNFSLYKGKSELFKDEDSFFDRNHLSAAGAEAFTRVLSGVIADSLAGQDSYDLFYESYETAEREGILPYHDQKT